MDTGGYYNRSKVTIIAGVTLALPLANNICIKMGRLLVRYMSFLITRRGVKLRFEQDLLKEEA